MAYNLARITKEFNEICNNAGVQVTCPIKISGRMTRTLGQVTHERVNGTTISTLVQFSKQLLETATDASISDVIKHEAAHYIATARTGEAHGHDSYFKAICAEIGATNDGTKTKVERTVDDSAIYKYFIKCEDCNKIIAARHRMSKNLKNLSACYCKKCGGNHLTLIQNF